MICPNCNTDNQPGAMFCRSCGNHLSLHNGLWWKEYNMEPLRTFKMISSSWAKFFCVILLILFLFCSFYTVAGIAYYIYDSKYLDTLGIALGFLVGAIIVAIPLNRLARNKVFVNKTLKKRGILADDYIQKYDSRSVHYVLFARGTNTSHKFGLIDVQNSKVILMPIYDELTWIEQGKLLSSIKDGQRNVIDVYGNIFQ